MSHIEPQYRVQNLVTNKEEVHHITQLREFHFDENHIDPVEIANNDQHATIVDHIVSHTPLMDNYKTIKRSDLEFRVRWKNLFESEDRYLTFSE